LNTNKLEISGISKAYGDTTALSSVDLEVREGEFLTLLGPSGSGKSTLLKIVAGMEAPSTGTVVINGVDATHMLARERDLGMVFQNYALMPHMTVFDNVAFPLKVRRRPKDEIRKSVYDALDIVRLKEYANRKPNELSGGQQQRVAISRAIVYNPSMVLMDEPLGALDKKLREQLQHEIRHLHQKIGITILYVTHDQQEAMSMSDRVVLMNQGAFEQVGTPEELYFKPKSEFAADFLGNSNFLQAELVNAAKDCLTLKLQSGETVRAPNVGDMTVGTKVRIMVRPEHISFSDGSRRNDDPTDLGYETNLVSGVTTSRVFFGGVVQFRAMLENRQEICVEGSSGEYSREFVVGEGVKLEWNWRHTNVFPGN